MKKKLETKHAKEMTTEEAIKHLFTDQGAKHIKGHVERLSRQDKKPKKVSK
jgi:hypothetical protein